MTTLNVPSWGNSALVTNLLGSFQFSTNSLPLGPVFADAVDGNKTPLAKLSSLQITSQPLGSDLEGYQRMVKFLQDSNPPFHIGSRRTGFAIVRHKDLADGSERTDISFKRLRRFAEASSNFSVSMMRSSEPDRISTSIYFESKEPYFSIQQTGSLLLHRRGRVLTGKSLTGSVNLTVGLDLLKKLAETDHLWDFWFKALENEHSQRKAANCIEDILNAQYRTGLSLYNDLFHAFFIPAGEKRLGRYLNFPLITLVQDRMLAGEAPFAGLFVDLVNAAAEVFPQLPLFGRKEKAAAPEK